MLLTTYENSKNLNPKPESIYDLDGKIDEIHYLDSVIPPLVVVHYESGNAMQKSIDDSIICYYHDVEIYESEILWYLERNLQNASVTY